MTVRTLADLKARLSNARHGNQAQDYRDLAESVYPEFELIDTQEVTGSAATITFSSIATTHKDLLITGSLRSAASGTIIEVGVQVGNGSVDTGSNYRYGGHLRAAETIAQKHSGAASSVLIGYHPSADNTAGIFWPLNMKILDYADTTIARQMVNAGGGQEDSSSSRGISWALGGQWVNTADAIDTVKLFDRQSGTDTFAVGSKLYLYGLG